jgi:Sulfotransferase family
MNQRNVIVHYHIFKNAGTTVASALARSFGKEFASIDSSQYNRRLRPQDLIAFLNANLQVAAISSHHLRPPVPTMSGVNFYELLLLRHPLDRIRSMCDFYRQAAVNSDPLTEQAKRLSLPAFLKFLIDNMPNLLADAQLNLVANGGARIPNHADFDRATEIITTMRGVGVVEEMDIFSVVAEDSLRKVFPQLNLSHNRENVSRGRTHQLNLRLRRFAVDCGETNYEKLLSVNQLDTQLVELARTEARRRYQEIPSPETHLRAFRKRVFRSELNYRVEKACQNIEHLWKIATGRQLRLRRVRTWAAFR